MHALKHHHFRAQGLGDAGLYSCYDGVLTSRQETNLKGIFEKLLLPAHLILLLATAQIAYAGTAYSDFTRYHPVDSHKLGGGAEVVTHRFGEYQLVEIFIPATQALATVHELRVKGTAVEAYEQITSKNTLAVVGGGFYGYDGNGNETPIGLTREDNVRKVAFIPWSSGGVLASDGMGDLKIYPVDSGKHAGRWAFALQSKPIIILNGNVDVSRNQRDSDFNRVAVGLTPQGDILIVGLFHGFGQAGTLVQFSRIYKDVADKRGIKILRALAMDGGAGAQIHVPLINKSFGDTGL